MSADDGSTFFPRYLTNISEAIASCVDHDELNFLLAKKAGYLARHSLPAEARLIVRNLRKQNQSHDPRLTGWTLLSEGLILHYESLDHQGSKAKFSRALMAGQIAQDQHLTSTAAAWLANSEYALDEIHAAIDHLSLSLQTSTSKNGDARGRALILLGSILFLCGKSALARHHLKEARKYAVWDGDIAMQNIIFFNLANAAVWDLTLRDCKEPLQSDSWRHVVLEVASAKNFNAALRIENLPSLIPTMEAELMVIQRNWHDAENIFRTTIHKLDEEGQENKISKLFAQRAWCRANIGDISGVKSDVADALLHISECSDLDDLLILHSRINQAASLIGDSELSRKNGMIAKECEHLFKQHQEKIFTLLDPVLKLLS